MSDRAPCLRCGTPCHIGELAVTMTFDPVVLEELIRTTLQVRTRERLLCACGTIDPERERALRSQLDGMAMIVCTGCGGPVVDPWCTRCVSETGGR